MDGGEPPGWYLPPGVHLRFLIPPDGARRGDVPVFRPDPDDGSAPGRDRESPYEGLRDLAAPAAVADGRLRLHGRHRCRPVLGAAAALLWQNVLLVEDGIDGAGWHQRWHHSSDHTQVRGGLGQ